MLGSVYKEVELPWLSSNTARVNLVLGGGGPLAMCYLVTLLAGLFPPLVNVFGSDNSPTRDNFLLVAGSL